MGYGKFMMVLVLYTNSQLIHYYRRIILGEWFYPFAFFIARFAQKEAKYRLGWRGFRAYFDRKSYFFPKIEKSAKKNLRVVS